MPNEDLSGALRASLRLIEAGDSPLTEATTDSIAELTNRINESLINVAPNEITDADLDAYIDLWRAKALQFAQEEQRPKAPRGKTKAPTVNVDLDLSKLDI